MLLPGQERWDVARLSALFSLAHVEQLLLQQLFDGQQRENGTGADDRPQEEDSSAHQRPAEAETELRRFAEQAATQGVREAESLQ